MLGLAHRGFSMTDYRRHIVHTLRDAGYHSVLAGLQHVAAKPEQIGYDEILHPATTQAADVAPQAVAFLNTKPPGRFSWIGLLRNPPRISEAQAEDDPRYIQPPSPIPRYSGHARLTWLRSMRARAIWIAAWARFSMPWRATGWRRTRW